MKTNVKHTAQQQDPLAGENHSSPGIRYRNYFKYWPVFFLSILVCMGLGYFYIKSTVPYYTVKAKILINDERDRQKVEKGSDLFDNFKRVNDEIEILTSRTLMGKVVNDLKLWINYTSPGKFYDKDIHSNTPVVFTLLEPPSPQNGHQIEVTIKDENSFILNQPESQNVYSFERTLKSKWGSWKLTPTANLKKYIGQTIQININNPDNVTDGYLTSYLAYLTGEQTSVAELLITETVPERGRDILNNLIKAYNVASIDYKNKVNLSTLSFLDDRLDSITEELNRVEKQVESYKSSRGITDLSSESQFYLDNVKNNDSRLNEVNVQLQVIDGIQRYINSAGNSVNAPATAGLSDPGLVSLVDQLIKLELQKDKLLANTPEKNPVFDPLNQQIASTKHAIYGTITAIKRSLLTTRKQLQKYNSGFESSIKKLPGQEREYINIKRQQSIKEELYIYLLQKREEAGLINSAKLMESRIVDDAHYGQAQSPNSSITYALAFIMGIIIPGGILFIKDSLNNKINNFHEIENAVLVPILGELSFQKDVPREFVLGGSRNMIAEQFRILRTKLRHINGKTGDGKVLLVTSGIPGEGKSMVACNLGAVMAASGRKTVILDMDFRKPQVAKTFNLSNDVGLSNHLNGTKFKEQIVQSSQIHSNLFIISSGPEPDNPSELLEKEALEELMTWLRTTFDEIIIDTPPVQLVADAMIVSAYSDVNLYVVRDGYTPKSDLNYINQLFNEHQMENMYIIYNGVLSKASYGYENKYAYQYFGNDKPKPKLSIMKNN
ncbi:GumC family protein [Pedobacter immunditicola]|uniref:GumC family protein n=1 Tax=Pedobacter immunditicola TaxID=3133440 RepID=UPI00309D1F40